MTGDEREEVTRLLAENRRLRELLTEHGIAWQPRDITPTTDRIPRLGTDEKVKLFASLFRGREDVYPVRCESKAGKSGTHQPARTSGGQVSARSRGSGAPTASTAR